MAKNQSDLLRVRQEKMVDFGIKAKSEHMATFL